MEVPILDKGIDDWGNDEQEEAYDKLQQLKQDFEGSKKKLMINFSNLSKTLKAPLQNSI